MSSALFAIGLLFPAFNPGWPPADLETPPSALAREEAMPDDPDYRPRNVPGLGCFGQHGSYSFTPDCLLNISPDERPLGTGSAVDRAWLWTTGRPEVTIAALEDGVDWSNADVIVKVALNKGELPVPLASAVHDTNNDGSFDVRDYTSATGTTAPTFEFLLDPRVTDTNGNGLVDPQDVLRAFADGIDGDNNVLVDDIAGWDFVGGDPDPGYSMPSALAASAAALANNRLGGAGACPGCTVLPLRVTQNALARGSELAAAIRYALARGARVIAAEAASAGSTSELRSALREAADAEVLVVASAGFSGSPMREGPWENEAVLVAGTLGFDDIQIPQATTALAPSRCGGQGPDLSISTLGDCRTHAESLGTTAGVLGLAISAALGIPAREVPPLDPPLSARELLHLTNSTSRDLARLPSMPGYDPATGYGRLDARALLDAVVRRLIPPEVELLSPQSHAVFDPTSGAAIDTTGFVQNRRSDRASWVLEWAPGRAPAATAFSALASGTLAAGETANVSGSISTASLFADPAAAPRISSSADFELTIRLVATGAFGGDLARAESRRVIVVHRDLELLPAFPIELDGDALGAPRAIDLTGDGAEDLVAALDDGTIHAVDVRGRILAGFPAVLPGNAPITGTLVAGAFDPIARDVKLALHSDDGRAFLIDNGGNVVLERETAPGPGFLVIDDLDGDDQRELLIAAGGVLTAVGLNGELLPGYPVDLSESTGAPATGDLDRDGVADIAIASRDNVFLIHGARGDLFSGWPVSLPAGGDAGALGLSELSRPAVSLGDSARNRRLELSVAARGRGVVTIDADGALHSDTGVFGSGEELALGDLDSNGELDGARASTHEIQLYSLENGAPIDTTPLFMRGLARGGCAILDLDGDGRKEVIFDGGDGTLEARNLDGTAPRNWPKVIGDSLAGSAQLGDLDGDGLFEVIALTRAGRLFAWRTRAPTTELAWSGARHDPRGTGNVETRFAVLTELSVDDDCSCRASRDRPSASALLCAALLFFAVHRLRRGAGAKPR